MSDSYTKLFSSITNSTIVCEPVPTRWLWVTMLAMVKRDGCVYSSIPGLARVANLSREDTEAGLQCFLSPDPDSRSNEFEGRRIEEIDGGWRLLNYAKYGAIRSAEERREYKRKWAADHRQADKRVDTIVDKVDKVDRVDPTSTNTNTSTNTKNQKQKPLARGSRLPAKWWPSDELRAWARETRKDIDHKTETEAFVDYWIGIAGARGVKLDWDATYKNWIRRATGPRKSGFVDPRDKPVNTEGPSPRRKEPVESAEAAEAAVRDLARRAGVELP